MGWHYLLQKMRSLLDSAKLGLKRIIDLRKSCEGTGVGVRNDGERRSQVVLTETR